MLYIYHPIYDEHLPDLLPFHAVARMAADLIRQQRRVLSHCGLGLNRSALMAGVILTGTRHARGRRSGPPARAAARRALQRPVRGVSGAVARAVGLYSAHGSRLTAHGLRKASVRAHEAHERRHVVAERRDRDPSRSPGLGPPPWCRTPSDAGSSRATPARCPSPLDRGQGADGAPRGAVGKRQPDQALARDPRRTRRALLRPSAAPGRRDGRSCRATLAGRRGDRAPRRRSRAGRR